MLADRRCTFVRGDVLHVSDFFDPLANADGVLVAAGIMASAIGENPWMGLYVNIRGFQNALDACRYQGVKKGVFSSSVGVRGDWRTTRPTRTRLALAALLERSGA